MTETRSPRLDEIERLIGFIRPCVDDPDGDVEVDELGAFCAAFEIYNAHVDGVVDDATAMAAMYRVFDRVYGEDEEGTAP